MALLGKSQKAMIMTHYPHFLAADSDVWTQYLKDPVAPITEVWYDVHVGQGMLLPVGASDMDRRISAGVSRKRIDVVARVRGGFWVIEVKPVASMGALGQILTYTRLFIQEYPVDGEVWPVIIADLVDQDLASEFDALGVVVIEN